MRVAVSIGKRDTHDTLKRFEREHLTDYVRGYCLGWLETCPEYDPSQEETREITVNENGLGVVLVQSTHEYAVRLTDRNGKAKFKLIRKNGLGMSITDILKNFVYEDTFDKNRHFMLNASAAKNERTVKRLWAAQLKVPETERMPLESIQQKFPANREDLQKKWNGASHYGTKCHKLCEDWYRGIIEFDDPRMTAPDVVHEMRLFRRFVESGHYGALGGQPFARDKFYMAEASMAFLPLLMTGQADLMLRLGKTVDGKDRIALIDYKFTSKMDQSKTPKPEFKSNFPDYKLTKETHYYVQLMLYKAMLEHFFPNVQIEQMYILNIDPTHCEETGHKKSKNYELIPVEYREEVVWHILVERQKQLMNAIEERMKGGIPSAPASANVPNVTAAPANVPAAPDTPDAAEPREPRQPQRWERPPKARRIEEPKPSIQITRDYLLQRDEMERRQLASELATSGAQEQREQATGASEPREQSERSEQREQGERELSASEMQRLVIKPLMPMF